MATKAPAAEPKAAADPQQPMGKARWNARNLKSACANFCNATSPREEVVLNFGVSNNRERTVQDMEIEFGHRVVLSPFAAKRLSGRRTEVIGEYESRYGELN